MKFVVRLHAEITIKSRAVQKRHGKILTNNLRKILARDDASIDIKPMWDRIEVNATAKAAASEQSVRQAVRERLINTPGISWFAEVIERPLSDFDDLAHWVGQHWLQRIENSTFCVRVKRQGQHDFNSLQLERHIGGYLLAHSKHSAVKLTQPQQTINLQIINQVVQLVGRREQGLGGYPLPTQETVLSLISGGFDSSVASYEFIRRGARTHFCFFNLGGDPHEAAVRQICYYLWQRFSASHPLKFISINFAPVVEDILTHCDNGLMGVVLKRQMLRAASRAAAYLKAQALVTGDAMGQVSSQTLSNLKIIDSATDALVLRPLITQDKQSIVDVARQIGVEPLARSIPEYCGVISDKPTVIAQRLALQAEEDKLDQELLRQVVNDAQVLSMQDIATEAERKTQFDVSTSDKSEQVIIDIRSPEAADNAPLQHSSMVLKIPFFKLQSEFAKLDAKRHYLLYCDQGVMSKMQVLLLQEAGYSNVSVLTENEGKLT